MMGIVKQAHLEREVCIEEAVYLRIHNVGVLIDKRNRMKGKYFDRLIRDTPDDGIIPHGTPMMVSSNMEDFCSEGNHITHVGYNPGPNSYEIHWKDFVELGRPLKLRKTENYYPVRE